MKKRQQAEIAESLSSALEPPRKRRAENLNSLLSGYADPRDQPAAPVTVTPPVESTAALLSIAAPKIEAQPLQITPPVESTAPVIITHREQYYTVPNELSDAIMPTLKPTEQAVLNRLYRLTRGFRRDRCKVSHGKLASACNISLSQARNCTQALERRGFIRKISVDMSNRNQDERGIEFEMLLPGAAPVKSGGGVKSTPAVMVTAPVAVGPMKETTQKEHSQTQQPVLSVASRFTLEECKRYADHLKASGQGITNPGGYSTTIHRSGEADALIEAFLSPPARPDISACPDCKGAGFQYIDAADMDKGVRPCKHEGLSQ